MLSGRCLFPFPEKRIILPYPGPQTDLVCGFFIWAEIGPNGSGRLDKQHRKYGLSEKQPQELNERRKTYAKAFQEAQGYLGILHRSQHQKTEVLS